jgi:aldehyde:ferredoxin oxidoreductase
MYPLAASPLKERRYEGDNGIEAQLYSSVTGDRKSAAELDLVAERIFNLHRALTIRDMGTSEMRMRHDTIPNHVFECPDDKKPFEPGVGGMDRRDIERAKDLFYRALGWDIKSGAPTRATLEKLGLKDVADRLSKMGLLPA